MWSKVLHAEVLSCLVTSDGIFTALSNKIVSKWDKEVRASLFSHHPKSGEFISSFKGHSSPVSTMKAVGQLLYTSSPDGTTKGWLTKDDKPWFGCFIGNQNIVDECLDSGELELNSRDVLGRTVSLLCIPFDSQAIDGRSF